MRSPVNILFADGISAAGKTVADAVDAMMEGQQPLSVPRHFNFKGLKLGVIPDLKPQQGESRAYTLLRRICSRLPDFPKEKTKLYLATTVGAIDFLERAPEGEKPDCTGILLNYAKQITGIGEAVLVAAACASGQTAAAMAMRALRNGNCRYALVIGIDICSEFVTGGFASLRAYATDLPHPYDADRDGLCLGEGCGALLLSMDGREKSVGQLLEALESCDASHITAPDLTGESLHNVISRTILEAGLKPDDIAAVIGHGTGTKFNDSSEINALNMTFSNPRPLLSIKGATGHTLGATGVLQIAYSLEFIRRGLLPPQPGLRTPAPGIEKFVSCKAHPLKSSTVLSLNVGFGGLNSAIIVSGTVKGTQARPQGNAGLVLKATAQIKPYSSGTLRATYSDETKKTSTSELSALDLPDLKRIITESEGFAKADLADFRRAADNVRLSQLCTVLCASAMGDEWSPEGTAIIGHNGSGCASNNKAFWDDFTTHGHDSGRATLFVPTLPSIPACEAAIALNIRGPVRYIATESHELLAEHLLNTFSGDETLRQIIMVEIFDDWAEAKLYSKE